MNGVEVREMRLRAGLKQYELAARLHITQTVLSEIELGKRLLSGELETRILNSLKKDDDGNNEKDKQHETWLWSYWK